MENTTAIVLKQAPVISHQLKVIGQSVTDRLAELNIDNLVATDDTIKSLKSTRADLNKELKDYEEQRKAIKAGVNKPYLEFEALYKQEVSDKYSNGIDTLKSKIDSFEMRVKDEKKAAIESYFTELCHSEKIDYLKFDQLGLDINLSTSEKAYKEKVNEFIDKVKDDVSLISSEEFAAEIFVEYKKTLNASQSITAVRARKLAEAEEKERIKQKMIVDRKNAIKALGFQEVSFTNSFNYNDQIYFTNAEIEDLTRDEFKEKYLKFEAEISELKKANTRPTEEKQAENFGVAYVAEAPKSEPLQAPKMEEAPVKKVVASFEVSGTMEQLKGLGEYMRANGITYKNI
jgi:hypothetical protein